ncbi:hypothetical protein GZZ44_10560 [Klebsiella aerogenes]|uniref:hypothetical protein n=1 Tax=Klebsiella aerogenes TaxID=548 RepID=UPI00190EEED2|nr:hypothetical protein [Klebsiella aerogenes]MBK0633389.1 hypothetical protein [Klebsiella aerogenes]
MPFLFWRSKHKNAFKLSLMLIFRACVTGDSMRSEQFKRLLADMTDQELDELKEWDCGSYWGNKSAIDLIDAEIQQRAVMRQQSKENPNAPELL